MYEIVTNVGGETRARIELAYRDFADLRLTTWPSGRIIPLSTARL